MIFKENLKRHCSCLFLIVENKIQLKRNRDAENNMFKNRLLNRPSINLQFITSIIVIVHLTVKLDRFAIDDPLILGAQQKNMRMISNI